MVWKLTHYDEQFRLRTAHIPSQYFGIIDNELWIVYMPLILYRPVNNPSTKVIITIFCNCCNYLRVYAQKCLTCNRTHPSLSCTNATQHWVISSTGPNRNNFHPAFRSFYSKIAAHKTRKTQPGTRNDRQPHTHLDIGHSPIMNSIIIKYLRHPDRVSAEILQDGFKPGIDIITEIL